MATLTYAALAVLPLVSWYLYIQVYRWRFQKYNHLPKANPQSFLFGHLKVVAEGFMKLGDSRRHFDYVIEDMVKKAGYPQMLFLDLRPANWPMVIVASHEIAEQVTRSSKALPESVPKSPTMQEGFGSLIGKKSLISEQGQAWKALRKRFNPGFAPRHLLTLLPQILEKTTIFVSKLDALACSGEDFDLDPLCTNLTFDIIGAIVTNLDCGAQLDSGAHDIVRNFRNLLTTFHDTGRVWLWLNIPVRIKRLIWSYQADAAIKKCIREKFAEVKESQGESGTSIDRSILALSLKDTDVLTPEILQSTADQVKSFLFAGHDTTSILLQRLLYALSIHPKCLAVIRAEHDAVFGTSDPQDVFLARPDETMHDLTYTSACIKETLRLWPPASSARRAPPGTGFRVRTEEGNDVCLDGTVLYLCHYLIQRDPKVYGETGNDFIPERWLGDTDTSAAQKDISTDSSDSKDGSKIPISAWRAFERGPRNCIGQELANLEARVILACVIRRYDFVKVGAGEVVRDEKGAPVVDGKGVCKTKSELWNTMAITSKPFDKCRMRVGMREGVCER